MASNFYVKQNGVESGPLTSDQLHASIASGRIRPDSMIRKGEDGVWASASRVSGLKFPSTSPTVPPAIPLSAPVDNQPEDPKLIPCKDCGATVSREAIACPKCGGPFRATFIRIEPYSNPTANGADAEDSYRRLRQLSSGLEVLAWIQLVCGLLSAATVFISIAGLHGASSTEELMRVISAGMIATYSVGMFAAMMAASQFITLAITLAGHAREIRDLLVRRP